MRIALADPDLPFCDALSSLLEFKGYEVIVVPFKPNLAVQIVREYRPDLLLLHCSPTDLSSLFMLAALLSDGETSHIPLILLASGDVRIPSTLRANVRAAVVKPFPIDELLRVINAASE